MNKVVYCHLHGGTIRDPSDPDTCYCRISLVPGGGGDAEREDIVRLIAWTGTGALPPTGKERTADKGREEDR